ncbi:mucin-5AC-like isoform X2 [Penaeus chinensis]|uniref:mucin-5AC-like isoform X2 n=1 Tax=Penaeus chinensis TaxID=139456 RepID=UPI001FB7E7ED|nr:mucin-5AC-like isoform X2 [Penaeus chinensis]
MRLFLLLLLVALAVGAYQKVDQNERLDQDAPDLTAEDIALDRYEREVKTDKRNMEKEQANEANNKPRLTVKGAKYAKNGISDKKSERGEKERRPKQVEKMNKIKKMQEKKREESEPRDGGKRTQRQNSNDNKRRQQKKSNRQKGQQKHRKEDKESKEVKKHSRNKDTKKDEKKNNDKGDKDDGEKKEVNRGNGARNDKDEENGKGNRKYKKDQSKKYNKDKKRRGNQDKDRKNLKKDGKNQNKDRKNLKKDGTNQNKDRKNLKKDGKNQNKERKNLKKDRRNQNKLKKVSEEIRGKDAKKENKPEENVIKNRNLHEKKSGKSPRPPSVSKNMELGLRNTGSIDIQEVCDGKIVLGYGESIVIYTDNNRQKEKCKNKIKTPKGTEIGFFCPFFDLNSKGCKKERLKFRGKVNGKKQSKKYCQQDAPDGVIVSTNKLTMEFKRKEFNSNEFSGGFLCEIYTVGDAPTTVAPPTSAPPSPTTAPPSPTTAPPPSPTTAPPSPTTAPPSPTTAPPPLPTTAPPSPTTAPPPSPNTGPPSPTTAPPPSPTTAPPPLPTTAPPSPTTAPPPSPNTAPPSPTTAPPPSPTTAPPPSPTTAPPPSPTTAPPSPTTAPPPSPTTAPPPSPTTAPPSPTTAPPGTTTCGITRAYCDGCGVAPISVGSTRIVNGTEASVGEYPYQVAVIPTIAGRQYQCGGSIIKERWILTAAHCFYDTSNNKATSVDIVYGTININGGGTTVTASRFIDHPGYDSNTNANDIALVELPQPLNYATDPNIQPICLGLEEDIPYGGKAVASGWGALSFGGSSPSVLREVELDIITINECQQKASLPPDTNSVVCALTLFKDTCQGDSGGPLVAKLCDGTWAQIGVVSYGFRCAVPDNPGVYTRVSAFANWISENTGGSSCSSTLTLNAELDNRAKEREAVNEAKNEVVRIGQELDGLETTLNAASGRRRRRRNLSLLQELFTALTNLGSIMLSRDVQRINSLSSELAALRSRLVVFTAEVAAGASGLDVPALLGSVGSAKQTAQNVTEVARQELAVLEDAIQIIVVEFENSGSTVPPLPSLEPEPTIKPTASPTTPPPTSPPATNPPLTTPPATASPLTTPPPTTPPPTTPPPTTPPPTTPPPTTPPSTTPPSTTIPPTTPPSTTIPPTTPPSTTLPPTTPPPTSILPTNSTEATACSVTRKYCEDCGVATVSVADSRIVGGADASSGEFPWQVGLATEFPSGGSACGGSLIKDNWVLSAAHCFFDDNGDAATSVVVQYGSINLATAKEVTAVRYITHENYDASSFLHDIALVELPQALDYANDPNVQPICLGEEEDYNFGGKVVATGWGYLSFDTKEDPEILQEVMLDLITTEQCKTMEDLPSDTSVICALTPSKDTCSGDSGGPLFTQLCDGRWAQLGIVSYGFECARPSKPGVYTKVSAYFDWIETNSGVSTAATPRTSPAVLTISMAIPTTTAPPPVVSTTAPPITSTIPTTAISPVTSVAPIKTSTVATAFAEPTSTTTATSATPAPTSTEPSSLQTSTEISTDSSSVIFIENSSVTTTTMTESSSSCFLTRTYYEDCGVAPVNVASSRIVGGADASSGEFPWQVGLKIEFLSEGNACGGSLIKSNWVLSAAHCFFDNNGDAATSVVVQYGSINLATAKEVPAVRYITHENYDASSALHDIALVELPQVLDYANDPNVQPICLGEEEDYNFGGKVVATGWGYLSYDTMETPEILQEVMLDLITTEDCKTMETLPSDTSVICALTTNKDTCSGDSGGPLFTQLCDGRWAQLGIVSYGFECARPSKPGVYTKVSAYFDWIETNSGESSSATPTGDSTESSSATPTGDSTELSSATPTGDSTEANSATPTRNSTESSSATPTGDSTESSFATPTRVSTESSFATPTGDLTESSSATPTGNSTETSSAAPTGDSTESTSATPTGDSTESSSATPTGDSTESSSATPTGDSTESSSLTPTGDSTESSSATPTEDSTESSSVTPTGDSTESSSATPTGDSTESSFVIPTGDSTESSSATPTGDSTEYSSATPTDSTTVITESSSTCSLTRKYCEDCGVASVSVASSRIVGGADASSGEFPWQVGLKTEFLSGGSACGGSLIKNNWVLSAAHCFFDDNGDAATSVVVQYGSINLATAKEVTAVRYITHDNYDASSFLHDIALVELPQVLDYANDPNVQPICLGEEEDYNFGGKVVATGWGYLSYDTMETPEILQEVMLDLITTEDCKTMETLPSDTSVICALTTNKDTCSGDSGGPLFTQLCDGRWAQLGIVSYGFECARPSKPGVYTKVSAYFDWIETNSGGTNCSLI